MVNNMDLSQNFTKIVGTVQVPSEEQAGTMSHSDLYNLREQNKTNPEIQNYLAPYEHRAFAREWVSESAIAPASLAVAIPVYAVGKATGIIKSDIQTSSSYIEEVKQGFIGIGEGLQAFFSDEKSEIKREVSPEVQRIQGIRGQVEQIIGDLIKTESGGRHTTEEGTLITSPTGAKGITQILPSTARKPGYGIKPLQDESEEEYIRFGKEYLAKMIDIFDNTEQGIAAYNAGPGAVHRAISKANRTGRDWKEFLPKEAKEYIQKVKYTPPAEPTFHKPKVTDVMGVRS